ncbi:MAG: cupin domain-containing protein [Deltaproteobacteria bacterium]|nr:cupin domain-containing protein [Deltaproteobacteria bacterium]
MCHQTGNIFDEIPANLSQEFFQTLAAGDNVRIERIVSEGQATTAGEWLVQELDEWVILLSGGAGLFFEGETSPRALNPGDYAMIPAGCRHRVEWTAPDQQTVWLAVHFR